MLPTGMLLTDPPNLPLVIGLPVLLLAAGSALAVGIFVALRRMSRQ
jgi:hypothetical protein